MYTGIVPILCFDSKYREATGKILEKYFIEFEFINETFSAPHNTDSLLLNLFNDQKLMLTNVSLVSNRLHLCYK